MGKAVRILIIDGWCCEFDYQEGNFIFADFETPRFKFVQKCQKCQICVI